MSWADLPFASLDFETTGVDVETARIVTAALVVVSGDGVISERTWLVDPGIEIPEEATAVHGITTEQARAEGQSASSAVEEIVLGVEKWLANGTPVVAFNAAHDLTVLDRECKRHGLAPLGENTTVAPVICPLTIDRAVDRYRRGSRRLDAVCAHYGVRQDGAHIAAGDAMAAARVAWALAKRYPADVAVDAMVLHEKQREYHRAWAENFEAHLAAKGTPERIPREWPVRPRPSEVLA